MADVDLVGAPAPAKEVPVDVTAEAPRSRVSGGAIASSYSELARGEAGLGQGLEDLATPIAEAQAASDVQNQKVTLGPDGKVQVLNPAKSVIFGPAGEAYGRTVVQSTAAQVGNLVDQQLTDIHQQHLGDPQGQAQANQSFLAGIKGATGNPLIDNAISVRAGEKATQHYDSNVDFTTRLNLERNARNDSQIVSDREEQLLDLAQNGVGAGNKTFDQAMSERQAALDRLQGSPLSKTPPELAAHRDDQFRRSLEAEATIGGIHNLVENGGGLRAAKDAVDKIRQDPQLDPSSKRRLMTQAQAAIEAETPAYNARVKANQDAANELISGVAAGRKTPDGKLITPDNWRVHDALEQSVRLGDLDSIRALDGAFVTYQHLKPGEALPDDARRLIYDLPGKDGSPPPSARTAPAAPAPAPTPAAAAPASAPGGVPDAYANIPRTDSRGEDQIAKFTRWNNDPIGNDAAKLAEVNPDLQRVINRARADNPDLHFVIGNGKRSAEEQDLAKQWGWSQVGSRDGGDALVHMQGRAVDLWGLDGNNRVQFNPAQQKQISEAVKKAAQEEGVKVNWGGDFKTFKDAPHFELSGPGSAEKAGAPEATPPPASATVQPAAFVPGELPKTAPPAGQYQPAIDAAAKKYGIDPVLLTRQLYQENRFRPTGTSPAGAQGFAQFIPSTAARYGVNVNDPNSSIEGAAHYMGDLVKRYNGNVGLALAAYNWGERNVDHYVQVGNRPVPAETQAYVQRITGHSISEWRNDPNLKTPTDMGGMGGGGGAAATDVRPYTDAQLRANPYLLSESVRALSADNGIKVSTLESMVEGMKTASKYIDQLPVEQVAAIKQYYDANPDDPRAQKLWGTVSGIVAAQAGPSGGPAMAAYQKQVDEFVKANPDIVHGWFADSFKKFEDERAKQKTEAPYDFAAARKVIAQAPQFNPAQPESTGAVLQARNDAAKTIGSAYGEAPPKLLQKDDVPILSGIVNGPDGAKALTSIALTANPETLHGLADQEETRGVLTQAWHSGDPMKMQGAYAVFDRMYKANPLDFDAKFKGVLEEMSAWKENMTADPKQAMAMVERWRSPDFDKTVKPMIDAANRQLTDDKIDVNAVAQKFNQGFFARLATGASAAAPPTPAGVDEGARNLELLSDYRKAYEKCFVAGGGPDGADKCATDRIVNKWSPSEVNGGRVTAWSPEAYYRNKDGSPSMTSDQMTAQLDETIRSTLGVPASIKRGERGVDPTVFGPNGPSREQYERLSEFNGPRVLVGDDTTRADYVVGKPPSYLVFIQRPSDGSWFPLMDQNGAINRVRFDPLAEQAKTINRANAQRPQALTPMPPPAAPGSAEMPF